MELALGTVQFGLDYGIAGGSRVDANAASRILAIAWEMGIRRLDTAPGYGDIESRLIGLCGYHPFSIVSKVPRMPPDLDRNARNKWLRGTVESSRRHLGETLKGLIFHDASLTVGPYGEWARETIAMLLAGSGIACGASHYDETTLYNGPDWSIATMAQVPGNAFDQRLKRYGTTLGGLEVSLRSAFLQGLLLMDRSTASGRLPVAETALLRWHEWCSHQGLKTLEAALAIVKGFEIVDFCLVGVDNEAQMQAIGQAWASVPAKAAPSLAVDDLAIIDPRFWTRS